MDYTSLLFMIFIWPFLYFIIPKLFRKRSPRSGKIPPGPYPFPVIGNILGLDHKKSHKKLAELSKTYGPIMTLQLGKITTILISSPEIAKEALTKNDLVFSDREIPDIMRALDHHKVSLVWLPASSQWRNLRKICTTNIFSPQKLDSTRILRQKKIQELLEFLQESSKNDKVIDIGKVAFTTVMNSLSYTFFSKDFAQYKTDSIDQEFKKLVEDIMEESGKPNVADFFPVLRFLDPQGVRGRGKDYTHRLLRVFNGIIDERMRLRASQMESSGVACGDALDSFLNLIENNDSVELTKLDFLHLLVDLFVAGTDTTTSTVEWAMAELLHNPQKMAKAKQELEQILGKHGKPVESDISKFPYLQAIVKETFRLHPPVPFLHHKSKSEAEICGFTVPKDAQVMINLWAIGRNPDIWRDPDSFVPERFLDCEMDIKGHDFELIPFGAGRRICPGLPLAHRSVHFVLASLLHCFDWKLADGQKAEDLNMDEKFGLAIRKFQPLRAIPIRKDLIYNY